MKIKRVTKLQNLSEDESDRLSKSYIREGYLTEIIPTELYDSIIEYENKYELHVYKIIRRTQRWYSSDLRSK